MEDIQDVSTRTMGRKVDPGNKPQLKQLEKLLDQTGSRMMPPQGLQI